MSFPVVLANPSDPMVSLEHYVTYENLGIAYIAATLRQEGFPTTIVDAYARRIPARDAADEIIALRPALMGVACTYQSLGEAYELARLVKKALPGTHICLGGEHATYSTTGILAEEPAVDSVCLGEGEATMLDLARRLPAGDLRAVLGLTFRDGSGGGGDGRMVENPPRPPVADLDHLPVPVRDTLDWCASTERAPLIGLLGSRGCAYDCHFCNAFSFFRSGIGPALRRRSPKKIVDELEHLYNHYYTDTTHEPIHFYDANFVYRDSKGREWAQAIAEDIIARGMRLNFAIYCRADSFAEGDDEFAAVLSQAGLSSAFVGLEAGSQDVLDRFHKRTSVEQNRWVLSFLRSHGVQTVTNGFIMFSPHSTLLDVRQNGRFLLDTSQASFWNLTGRLQLFPGVKLIESLRVDGLLLPTYAHARVHDYRFVDERVALLVDRLSFGDHPAPARENHLSRYIQMAHFEIKRRLEAMGREGRGLDAAAQAEAAGLSRAIEEERRALDERNYRFVMDAVDLAEASWDQPRFEAAKAEYLDGFQARLETLRQTFERYVDFIDRSIG